MRLEVTDALSLVKKFKEGLEEILKESEFLRSLTISEELYINHRSKKCHRDHLFEVRIRLTNIDTESFGESVQTIVIGWNNVVVFGIA